MSDSGARGDDSLASPLALLAQRAERARLGEVGALPWVDTLAGDGWLAIRSGAESNDLNGVLSEPGVVPGRAALVELARWFGDVPATWHAAHADDTLTSALVEAGWRPERTGRCAGRALPLVPSGTGAGVSIRLVEDESDRRTWLDIARACGWFGDDSAERRLRENLARDLAWPRWLAEIDGAAVGMATGWRDGGVLELVDIAVIERARRRGVGTALLSAVCAWGEGADHVVGAPSPDGWGLLRAHGFANVPTVSDTAFYRVGQATASRAPEPRG